MEYRVEQLAAACDVSVDTVRYYQSRGLLPPPRRAGRIALYERDHVQRIRQIRSLQRKGLSLTVIHRVLSGTLGRGDADLAAAIADEQGGDDGTMTLTELAARSGVSAGVLRAVQKAGLGLGRSVDGSIRYSVADAELVRHGLRLLDAGIPVADVIAVAAAYDGSARALAEKAVQMFDVHVRAPIKAKGLSERETARQLVGAFRDLLPAVTVLVAHHFRRTLLAAAEEHIERTGDEHERAASRARPRTRKAARRA